ncbi:MAG: DsbA family protein [Polyangiaceae bacterium]|nr:DsbA family protein [Polyangiaceae bacterium]
MNSRFTLLALVPLLLTSHIVAAQTPTCDALPAEKKQQATVLMNEQRLYACCDGTISACLKENKCSLATRLANQVCRMVGTGKDKPTIERALAKRAETMTSVSTVPIDISRAPRVGEAQAPVSVSMYLCTRCPYCARFAPQLHKAISEGPLKGVAKAYVREFPIRSHAGSTEGAMGIKAAERMGRGWDFLLAIYRNYDQFDPANMPKIAADLGLDQERFSNLLQDEALRSELAATKKEGVRNNVELTPTIFINGRKYAGEMTIETISDVIAEEAERLK